MKVLIIHGPNLNLLEKRDNFIYGGKSLEQINELIRNRAMELDMDVEIFQSNHEGEIVDKIQDVIISRYSGLIINPGGFTHYSIVIRDAIEMLEVPVIEVHLSNISGRENFRRESVIAPVCTGQISGLGSISYLIAMDALKLLNK
ncbi:type II 3-dehydroquinate dehydratase [Tissierella praeacuta]|uniref:3-dehydroquinate dehydratase n=1 Tax=Tissierella praeacuta DSM 18095 TaxID=1123404 RepID=A0A1M4SD36_9FIRM|nr:type II 3-dehydroquinate dehydratase [Tissierella praeacuta]MBU5254892.1 type II 3-dehydroquinate dehydratase [Tissierella praeacuta]SHE29937.1 3-dehydroquinate dehydratase [Tissierella praeacuta DSM 18095]SUP01279.1 3-dehydroquinate dehydratase [Tissierella praeacuta]